MTDPLAIPILWQDESLVAVNKPHQWLVHPTQEDAHETRSVMVQVRDQIGRYLYPVHRLDKPTSGVLLFALSAQDARVMGEQFMQHRLRKFYLGVCRGWLARACWVDHAYALRDERGGAKPAQSRYWPLAYHQIEAEIERYPQSRFSLLAMEPVSGRRHQLRRHLKHLNHPLMGDVRYGRGPYNRYMSEHYGVNQLLLHAYQLQLNHPRSGEKIMINAPLPDAFATLIQAFGWQSALSALSPLDLSTELPDAAS